MAKPIPDGYYSLTPMFNITGAQVYDMRHRAFRFDVEFGDPHEEYGFVSLGGTWEGDILDGAG